MKNTTRAIPVDLLRIFAASAIFYVHGGLATGWPLSGWGDFAVATFIYLSSGCATRFSQPAAGGMRTYWLSRFRAIYPTFAIISVAIFAASFIHAPNKTGSHYTVAELAANLMMISEYIGKPWLTEPMWFVPFVLQVYLILPLLMKIPARRYILPAAFLVSGMASAGVFALNPGHPVHAHDICRNWSPIFRLPEVMFGCLLGRAGSVADAITPMVIYAVCCALTALLAIHQSSPVSTTLTLPLHGLVVFLVLAAAVAAILPFIKDQQSAAIAILGRAALPFFLLHGVGIGFMSEKFGRNNLAWILYFVLCWAGSVIFVLALAKVRRREPRPGRCPS
jgi:peptidoglycan/LPS O-acetylase OafA/YrhL